jgi:3-oxoacyl-[acyl-carrier-protein] synthase-3
MATARFRHARVTGVVCTVGSERRPLRDDPLIRGMEPAQAERLLNLIGIDARRVSPRGVTALDLCENAARNLLRGLDCPAAMVDAVVFVTQTPDFQQPSTANLLHGRMFFPKTTAAFDVNQGCSGWVYGLYLASAMIEAGGCHRVLLLAGDTVTQTINSRDRSTALLFGDAGSATMIERSETPVESFFMLHSDGSGHDAIKVPAGAFREPLNQADLTERTDAEGNVRRRDQLHMNGVEVLNFTLREEPAAVRALLEAAGAASEAVDHFVFHQANRFIVQNLAKRLRLPADKVPVGAVSEFGNQSSASIPGVLCHDLSMVLSAGAPARVLASGFGVGLSWASCLLWLHGLKVCNWVEHPGSDGRS